MWHYKYNSSECNRVQWKMFIIGQMRKSVHQNTYIIFANYIKYAHNFLIFSLKKWYTN